MVTLHRVCACLAAFAMSLPAIAAAQERTDAEIVELILREGPAANAVRAQHEVVRREQLARVVYPNPVASYNREGAGFTEFLQIEQGLPLFGTRAALQEAGVAAEEAAQADRDARLWLLRTRALDAASRVVAQQQALATAEQTAAHVERLIALLRIREQEGEGSRFDRLRAEHELVEARQIALAAAADLAEARAVLASMLPATAGVPQIAGRPAEKAREVPDVAALTARATAMRPELRALQRGARRAELEAVAARRARMPLPIVSFGMKRADNAGERERGAVFGVSASVPLFDTGSREAERWDAERARAVADRAALEREIGAQVRAASETLAARRGVLRSQSAVSAEELASIAETAYREGEIGIFELLDAVRASARAHARDIEMRLNVRLAEIALERAVGDVLWP